MCRTMMKVHRTRRYVYVSLSWCRSAHPSRAERDGTLSAKEDWSMFLTSDTRWMLKDTLFIISAVTHPLKDWMTAHSTALEMFVWRLISASTAVSLSVNAAAGCQWIDGEPCAVNDVHQRMKITLGTHQKNTQRLSIPIPIQACQNGAQLWTLLGCRVGPMVAGGWQTWRWWAGIII